MDRTVEFVVICNESKSPSDIIRNHSPSPFLLKASDMLDQLNTFHSLLLSTFDNYVGYNRYLPDWDRKVKLFTTSQRNDFNKETLVFISSMATEIKHLSRMLDADTDSMTQHNKQVVSFLLNRLGVFTNLSEQMQRKQKSLNIAPFRLLAGTYDSIGFIAAADNTSSDEDSKTAPKSFFGKIISTTIAASTNVNSSRSSNSEASNANFTTKLDGSFAQRYVDEIAPPSKMAVYRSVATTHKQSLLQEARILQVRFSDDKNESEQMEREVSRISQLLVQFASLVAGQSEVVGDIHGAAQQATRSVKDADDQLKQTITRSQYSQWYTVLLVLGLSVLVLLLDGLTP